MFGDLHRVIQLVANQYYESYIQWMYGENEETDSKFQRRTESQWILSSFSGILNWWFKVHKFQRCEVRREGSHLGSLASQNK